MRNKAYYKKSHFHEENHKRPRKKTLYEIIEDEAEEQIHEYLQSAESLGLAGITRSKNRRV